MGRLLKLVSPIADISTVLTWLPNRPRGDKDAVLRGRLLPFDTLLWRPQNDPGAHPRTDT